MKSKIAKALALACFAAIAVKAPTQAHAQSANDPLSTISEADLMNAMSLFRPSLQIVKKEGAYDVTLPNGITAEAMLQNCQDRETLSGCRTLSMIVNLGKPKGKSRDQMLAMVNELNKRDIHGRSFLNDNNQVIARWSFFVTGHENSRGLGKHLINWDAFVKRAYAALYADND